MIDEVRHNFRVAVIKEVFGDAWKPSRPLNNIGGLLLPLLQGQARTEQEYQNRAGRIMGMIEAMNLLDAAVQAMGEPGTEERR